MYEGLFYSPELGPVPLVAPKSCGPSVQPHQSSLVTNNRSFVKEKKVGLAYRKVQKWVTDLVELSVMVNSQYNFP